MFNDNIFQTLYAINSAVDMFMMATNCKLLPFEKLTELKKKPERPFKTVKKDDTGRTPAAEKKYFQNNKIIHWFKKKEWGRHNHS